MNIKTIYFNDSKLIKNENIIISIILNTVSELSDMLQILSSSNSDLTSVVLKNNNDAIILLSGNALAYKSIFNKLENNNSIARRLLNEFYNCSWSYKFDDFIDNGLMENHKFRTVKDKYEKSYPLNIDYENTEITNIDPIDIIMYEINDHLNAIYGDEIRVNLRDLIRICNISFKYKLNNIEYSNTYTVYDFLQFVENSNKINNNNDLVSIISALSDGVNDYLYSIKEFDKASYISYTKDLYKIDGEYEMETIEEDIPDKKIETENLFSMYRIDE